MTRIKSVVLVFTLIITGFALTSCGGKKQENSWLKIEKIYGFERANPKYTWETFCGAAFVPVFNAPEIKLELDPLLLSGIIAYSNSSENRDPNLYRDALLNNAFMQSILWPLGNGLNLGMHEWNQNTETGRYVTNLLDQLSANAKSHENLCASENKRLFDWNAAGMKALSAIPAEAIPSQNTINQAKLISSNYPKYETEILKTVAKQDSAQRKFDELKAEYGSPNLVRCKEYATNLPGKTLIQCKLPS
jgi:hypothetical protein